MNHMPIAARQSLQFAPDLVTELAALAPEIPAAGMPRHTLEAVLAEYRAGSSRADLIDRLVAAWGEAERHEARNLELWRLRLRVVLAERSAFPNGRRTGA